MKKTNSMQNIVNELNGNIENYLSDNNIKPRREASPGLWLCFILPICIILGSWNYPNCSHFYRSATCLSVGLMLSSLTIVFLINQTTQLRTTCCVINSITTTLLLGYFSDHGLVFIVLLGAFSSFGFNKLLLTTLQKSPESFTFGEAAVIVEAAIIFVSSVLGSLFFSQSVTCVDISTKILQGGLTGLLVLMAAVYFIPQLRSPAEFYTALAALLVTVTVVLHVILGFSSIIWIIYLVIEDTLSLQMVAAWLVLTAVAVSVTATQVSAGHKASTVVRKYFHVLALCVFVPGLLFKPCLLYLASGIIFALFLGIEMVRVLKLPPVAAALDSAFAVFADEKDSSLALTPIYLLVGCAAPLWLHPLPLSEAPLLPLLAGLLSVGLGDTAASVCGSWCGHHHWPDSQKTKEGTAACFLAQLFFVIALIHFGYVPRNNLLQPIVAISVVSWVEATTDQIDNLALPFLMYALLL